MRNKSLICALFLMMFYSFVLSASLSQIAFTPQVNTYLDSVFHDYFASYSEEEIKVTLLSGGYSAITVRLETPDHTYVLRVINETLASSDSCTLRPVNPSVPSLFTKKEICAMQQAACAGLAPAIYWISADKNAVLMDYIPVKTLSIETAKNRSFIINMADQLNKVHALEKNPFKAASFGEYMEVFYHQKSKDDDHSSIFDLAINIIREGALLLKSHGSFPVNTHGDLNPRNILWDLETIYFIDWSETMYTDAFHDLGYYSVMLSYNAQEDLLLLESYLNHKPTLTEKKRFLIAKKMNFARLAMGNQYMGTYLRQKEPDDLCYTMEIREWSYYAKVFADNEIQLTSNFFFKNALAAIEAANSITLDGL